MNSSHQVLHDLEAAALMDRWGPSTTPALRDETLTLIVAGVMLDDLPLELLGGDSEVQRVEEAATRIAYDILLTVDRLTTMRGT